MIPIVAGFLAMGTAVGLSSLNSKDTPSLPLNQAPILGIVACVVNGDDTQNTTHASLWGRVTYFGTVPIFENVSLMVDGSEACVFSLTPGPFHVYIPQSLISSSSKYMLKFGNLTSNTVKGSTLPTVGVVVSDNMAIAEIDYSSKKWTVVPSSNPDGTYANTPAPINYRNVTDAGLPLSLWYIGCDSSVSASPPTSTSRPKQIMLSVWFIAMAVIILVIFAISVWGRSDFFRR